MFLRRKAIDALPDEDLVRRIRDGHGPSLGMLWDRYAHLLFGVCMKYLKDPERSKDLVMELFEGLPLLLDRHTVRSFRPWVHTVMRNRCLMALRGTVHAVPVDDLEQEGQDDAGERMLHEATLQRLEEAIERLNPDQRTCIRLFHLERLSYQEVSARTGLDVEAVRSHLQNGRRNLRIQLQRHGEAL
jgi:RNA polymerase sigma-70 factor (ECF subfamily)